jgi:hypothetical protein
MLVLSTLCGAALAGCAGTGTGTVASAPKTSSKAVQICRSEVKAAGTLSSAEKAGLRPECSKLTGSTPVAVQAAQRLICIAVARDTLPRSLQTGEVAFCRRLSPEKVG